MKALLSSSAQLVVKQVGTDGEKMHGYNFPYRYLVFDPNGQCCGKIVELRGRNLYFFVNWIFRSHRAFFIIVQELDGAPVLTISRKLFFFRASIQVKDSDGSHLGSINERSAWFKKRYELRDLNGVSFASIENSLLKCWEFLVKNKQTENVGTIFKKWSEFNRDVFKERDNFVLDLAQGSWSFAQRAVLFAATLAAEFDHFEYTKGNRG